MVVVAEGGGKGNVKVEKWITVVLPHGRAGIQGAGVPHLIHIVR